MSDERAATGEEGLGSQGLKAAWEMELLISGALVFSLLQLPGPMIRALARVHTRVAGTEAAIVSVLGGLALTVVVILAATFVVHLAGRAYWVALLGLRHVFPGWIRWERLQHGPAATAVNRESAADPGRLVGRVDAFCSATFSLGFAVVAIAAVEGLLAALLTGAAAVASQLLPGLSLGGALGLLAGVPLLLALLVSAVDSLIGRGRLRCLGGSERYMRFARATLRAFGLAFGGPLWGPVFMVFRSNLELRRFAAVLAAVFLAMAVGVPVVVVATSGDTEVLHSLRFFPAKGSGLEVNPNHFRDARPADEVYLRTPSIQSEVVDGPVVTLFLPHAPRVDNELLGQVCPSLAPLRSGGLDLEMAAPRVAAERLAEVRDCLRRLWRVELDGAEVSGAEFLFFTEPAGGVHGLLGYLPTAGLGAGRHELRVTRFGPGRDHDATPADPYGGREDVIRFWLTR